MKDRPVCPYHSSVELQRDYSDLSIRRYVCPLRHCAYERIERDAMGRLPERREGAN